MVLLASIRAWLLEKLEDSDSSLSKILVLVTSAVLLSLSGILTFTVWTEPPHQWTVWVLGGSLVVASGLAIRNLTVGKQPFILDGVLLVFFVALQMWSSASISANFGGQQAHPSNNASLLSTILSVVHRLVSLLCVIGKGDQDLDDEEIETLRRGLYAFSKPLLLLAVPGALPNLSTAAWGGIFANFFPFSQLLAICVMFVCYVLDQESDHSAFVLTE